MIAKITISQIILEIYNALNSRGRSVERQWQSYQVLGIAKLGR